MTCCMPVRYHPHCGVRGPTFARVLYQKWSISNPYTTSLCILSVHYVGCRELATTEAHTVANHPQPAIQHMRLVGPTTGQHQPGREKDCGGPYLKHGGGVGPKKERICRFRSHLRAKYKRQCEILAVRFLRVPPVRPSMCADVMGWMLEQGECSRIRGQQLVMHREARRTFEPK